MIDSSEDLITQIKLSRPDTGEIVFYFRPYPAALERETRQHLFGMTEREQCRASPKINLFLLRALSCAPPTGLPDSGRDASEYFSDGNPIKEKILDDALTSYLARLLPAEYLRAFRVACWQHVYFRRTLAALDTKFDNCPFYCDQALLRPAKSCNECEFTLANIEYQELGAEMLLKWEPDSPYSFADLSSQTSFIAGLAEFGTRSGYAAEWTITTARLVDIYRAELVKADRVDSSNEKNEPQPD